MKKIIIISLFALAFSSQAFFNNNSQGWGNNNGFFGFNPYEYTDPNWYTEEMSDMFDEFGNGFGNNNNNNNNFYRGFSNPYNSQFNQRLRSY